MKRELLFVLLASGALAAARESEAAQASVADQVPAKPETPPPQAEQVKSGQAPAEDAPAAADGESKLIATPGSNALGISILGNQEAPTSLVIVPWKTSELGNSLGISPMLDDSRQPVDKDVFMRSLRYHEISSGTTGHDGARTGGRSNAAAGNDAAQSVTAAPRRE